MKGKTLFSIIGLAAGGTLAVFLLLVSGGTAGEWHSGTNNICWDCHTMHFSMGHGFGGGSVSTTGTVDGNWLSTSGPNAFLLKAPANQLCLACHDGQSFAPDVLGANANASPSQGRSAGALNETGLGAPYEEWKGHTLDSTTVPPGWDPATVGAPVTWYNASNGLECISCHAQHGPTTAYRNLGPYSLGGAATALRPTYVISAGNTTTRDVWIHLGSYTAGSGFSATFNPYYDYANLSFNRNDATVGTTNTSNRMDTFCGGCHGQFHGGPGNSNIGGTPAVLDGFIRHPTSQVTLGAAGTQGYGGHSSLTRFVANTTKTRVYASDTTAYTDASPGCVSCHKGHGNQNPFGLFFLNGNATSVGEEGGYSGSQSINMAQGYRNLCGQCHGQGN